MLKKGGGEIAEENRFKIEIRRVKPMSEAGFNRLGLNSRRNFKPVVYKPVFRGYMDKEKVYDESTLAKWLFFNLGAGEFVGHTHIKSRSRKLPNYSKSLFQAVIRQNSDVGYSYHFEHTRGIARYGWFIGEI